MDIYLDANATTPVLPQARAAALAVMTDVFGNPSSIHGSGLKAREVLDQVRATARRVLDVADGRLLFTSGATEGIQTAVLSALLDLRQRRDRGETTPTSLLYGATEHKAVPQALEHWNAVLDLGLGILAIPVCQEGRHDLAWLRQHAPQAGLVCTMAANNETGVISDLDGISDLVRKSPALWLVDGVQALGKLPLRLRALGIDYAPFSGHKLYAPKGIGMLYVRSAAPFTPLMAGGGQEGALRSGTENMAGIAALGAVLSALEQGGVFATNAELAERRLQLAEALRTAFPGVAFNAPFATSLPTTLNISVPGLSARLLLDALDANGVRASGGSACGAATAKPSHVLAAMGLPPWQTAAAVRLSFGAADPPQLLTEACRRLLACGESLRASCEMDAAPLLPTPLERVTRFSGDGACCYVLADVASRRCTVIDPQPGLNHRLARWLRCRGCTVVAVLTTCAEGERSSAARDLRAELADIMEAAGAPDAFGWPQGTDSIAFGDYRLARLPVAGDARTTTACLAHSRGSLLVAFVGDALRPDGATCGDVPTDQQRTALDVLQRVVGSQTLLLPSHDHDDRIATTLAAEGRAARAPLDGMPGDRLLAEDDGHAAPCGRIELNLAEMTKRMNGAARLRVVDVREAFEARISPLSRCWGALADRAELEAAPLSALVNHLPGWRALATQVPIIFCCRTGHRSAQAARALRRLGRSNVWSLAGGLALLPTPPNVPPP